MFTKHKKVAQVEAYKKVTDWNAVFGAIFWGIIGLSVLVFAFSS